MRSIERDRDRGSVLPMVLILILVAGLVVIPLLRYNVAVFKANTVVSSRTKNIEAAKGGIRMALGDPRNVFLTCDGSGNLTPADPVINGTTITVTCDELDEIGPLEALGLQVPMNVVATQLGAVVPDTFAGSTAQSDPVPPYPATADWWQSQLAVPNFVSPPDGDIWAPDLLADKIWMPDLPQPPSTVRSSTPYDMPAVFDCRVYFPGTYADPLDLTGNIYFVSGVYYFENEVKVHGNADVVVGYGLEELPTECSDDIQVSTNVINGPNTIDWDGGGATWVFGANGHLVVDNTDTTTSLKLRFNQRYSSADKGGLISIMSANGYDDPLDPLAADDHVVTNVNKIPRSLYINAANAQQPIDGSVYVPSSITYTDHARPPASPAGLTLTPHTYFDGSVDQGAALVTWDEMAGQDAGGALIDGYTVTVSPPPDAASGPVCPSSDLVFSQLPDPPGGNQISCVVRGLDLDTTAYTVEVLATNEAGVGPVASDTVTPMSSDAAIASPDAPTDVIVDVAENPAEALVSWDPPSSGGAPITGYEVTAFRVYLDPAPITTDPPPDPADPPIVMEEPVVGAECSVVTDPTLPLLTSCVVPLLPDLLPGDAASGNQGYRFAVTATNSVGVSPAGYSVDPPEITGLPLSFNGGGPAVAPPAERIVAPWVPEPIIDVRTDGSAAPVEFAVAGYVSVPMGRIAVTNLSGQPVSINGGVMAATFGVEDSRATPGLAGSVPIGFKNDIVLQRKIRIVARAKSVTSTAVVQINEDGAGYAVNSWVVG